MSEQPDNIMLVYLRRIDAKLDQVNETLRDHGRRITALEIAVANLGASLASYVANSSLRACAPRRTRVT